MRSLSGLCVDIGFCFRLQVRTHGGHGAICYRQQGFALTARPRLACPVYGLVPFRSVGFTSPAVFVDVLDFAKAGATVWVRLRRASRMRVQSRNSRPCPDTQKGCLSLYAQIWGPDGHPGWRAAAEGAARRLEPWMCSDQSAQRFLRALVRACSRVMTRGRPRAQSTKIAVMAIVIVAELAWPILPGLAPHRTC